MELMLQINRRHKKSPIETECASKITNQGIISFTMFDMVTVLIDEDYTLF